MTTHAYVDSPSHLGGVVRDARARCGLTQAELARDAGVGRQWLVAFEAGDKESAPLDMVFRLLRTLGLSVVIDAAPVPPAVRPVPIISASGILRDLVAGPGEESCCMSS